MKIDDADAPRKSSPRSYDTSKRRAAAANSRQRIIEAAADLFAEHGYAATTLAHIAARAGVTTKLVVANGPKGSLLMAALERRFGGVEGAGPAEAEADAARILAEPDPIAMVNGWADYVIDFQQSNIGLWRALTAAASVDADARAAYATAAAGRESALRAGIDLLAERGLLRAGPREQHVATLALLMGFDPYQLMVLDWGWTPERLRSWFIATLMATVLDLDVRRRGGAPR